MADKKKSKAQLKVETESREGFEAMKKHRAEVQAKNKASREVRSGS